MLIKCFTLIYVYICSRYAEHNPISALVCIVENGAPSLAEHPLTADARDFISQCWTTDQHKRPKANDLLGHRWLK